MIKFATIIALLRGIKLDYLIPFISNSLLSGQLAYIIMYGADANSLIIASVLILVSVLITIFASIDLCEAKPYVLSMTYIFVCSVIFAIYLYETYDTLNDIPDKDALILLVMSFLIIVFCTLPILIDILGSRKPKPEVKEGKIHDQLINDVGYDKVIS